MSSIPQGKAYGDIVRDKILFDTKDRKSVRQVARDINYSYEHVRKVCRGFLTFTKEFNDVLCKYLKIDAVEMWKLAQTEKLKKRFDGADLPVDMPRDSRIKNIWHALNEEQRNIWIRIGEGYALQNGAEKEQASNGKVAAKRR